MSIMRAQLPRELHAYGDMVGNRAGLETGAPSITYQGQEGPQAGGQPRPEEIIIQLQEAYKQHRAQGGQLTFEEFVEVVMSQNQNRQQAAYGGIMGVDGRRQYGIGSWFQKKVMDPIKGTVKKAIDNPLLTAAAVGTLANYKDIIPGDRDSTGWFGNLMRNITGPGKGQTERVIMNPTEVEQNQADPIYKTVTKPSSGWMGTARDIVGSGITSALSNPNFLIPAAGLISGAFAKEDDPGYTGQGTGLNIRDIGKIANITDEKQGQAAGLRFLPQVSARKYTPEEMISTYATTEAEDFSTPETKAKGGRIGYDIGGDVNFDIFSDEEKAKFKSMGEKMNVPETPRVFSDEERTKFESMLSDPNFGQGEGETAWEAQGGIQGEDPKYAMEVNEAVEAARRNYMEKINSGEIPFPNNLQWQIDKIGDQTRFDMWEKYKQNKAQGGRIGYAEGTEGGAVKKTYNTITQRKIKMLQGLKNSGIGISAEDDKWLQEHTGQAQGGRIGYDMGGDVEDVEIPEQFLEDLKRRDFDRLLDDYRRWQENQERQKYFGPGGMEVAQGGRIGAQEGGLMSLGGNEMDLRGGGFVPIGEREKADDVPARLSKNEFVFTADAVRAAGGGDVNKGADKMYRTMKELEGVVA